MKHIMLVAATLTALLGIHSATLRAADPVAKPAPAPAKAEVKAEPAKPAAAAEKTAPAKPAKGKTVDIRGKVTAVDPIGMTITIEQKKKTQVYHMTSSTRLYVNDKPVMLKEITAGAKAAGTGKMLADGKADLLDLYVTAAKEAAPEGEKKVEPAKKAEGKKAAAKKEEAKPAKAPAKKAAPAPVAASTNAAPALPAPIGSVPPLPAK